MYSRPFSFNPFQISQHKLFGSMNPKEPVEEKKFSNFSFPLVRRVFSPSFLQNIVSVQPMTAPVGSVFYYDRISDKISRMLKLAGLKTKAHL